MSGSKRVRLGDVVGVARQVVAPDDIDAATLYVGLEHIESSGSLSGVRAVEAGELASAKFAFSERHILYGKLRPYLSKIARPSFCGVCSTDILPLLPGPEVDRDFLFQHLRRPSVVEMATARSAGANLPRLSPQSLCEFEIPLPPLPDQRRLAAILDKADELRARRRAALAALGGLAQSVFLEMFGDPAANSKRWRSHPFTEVLANPLRNGVSPSKGGRIQQRVLTLSAVTGSCFDESACKEALFAVVPAEDQRVKTTDLLICRGNGNVSLVGKGYFPTRSMPDVVFPDTIIAAGVDPERIAPEFLEVLWNSPTTRQQLERMARTTNGIFKVNQEMLERVELIAPPLSWQQGFSRFLGGLRRVQVVAGSSRRQLDAVFSSLQHRAFAGEL